MGQAAEWRKKVDSKKGVKSESANGNLQPSNTTVVKVIELLDEVHSWLEKGTAPEIECIVHSNLHMLSDKLKLSCRRVYAGLCGSANEMRYCKSCKKDRLISEFKLKPGSIEHGATCERCLRKKKHAYHDERQKAASIVVASSPDTKLPVKSVVLHPLAAAAPRENSSLQSSRNKSTLAAVLPAARDPPEAKTKTKIRRTTQTSAHLPEVVRIEVVVRSPAGGATQPTKIEVKKHLHTGVGKQSSPSSIDSLFTRFQISQEVVFQVAEVCESHKNKALVCTKPRCGDLLHCGMSCYNKDKSNSFVFDEQSKVCNNPHCDKPKKSPSNYCTKTCQDKHEGSIATACLANLMGTR